MIEALAILVVFLTAALIYLGAQMQAQSARRDPVAELARLRESLVWHDERLRLAKENQWDAEMISRIAGQRAEISGQLTRFHGARRD
jgi:hypothetical protein